MPRRRRASNPSRPMNAWERGNWIDGEGTLTRAGRERGFHLKIIQDHREREVLEDYCKGALRDGISRCEIVKEGPYTLSATIARAEDIAREITLTRDHIRTKKKKSQIEAFIRGLPPIHPKKPQQNPKRNAYVDDDEAPIMSLVEKYFPRVKRALEAWQRGQGQIKS